MAALCFCLLLECLPIMSAKPKRSRFVILACALLCLVVGPVEMFPQETKQFETRCGWFHNPTPANVWLSDRDGQWIIGTQGGYQLEGDWDWPQFKRGQWVLTNVASYGYGCACLQLRVNKDTHQVVEIKSARARPLSACRKDPKLKKWKL